MIEILNSTDIKLIMLSLDIIMYLLTMIGAYDNPTIR